MSNAQAEPVQLSTRALPNRLDGLERLHCPNPLYQRATFAPAAPYAPRPPPSTRHRQAKESSRSFRTALLLMLATWLPGATARTTAPAALPQSHRSIQGAGGGTMGQCATTGQWVAVASGPGSCLN
eukprot:scaffold26051_cov47-Phaeocystis_antarctica.AAC.1